MHTNKCDSVWLYVKKSYKETFINSRICLNITIQNNQKKNLMVQSSIFQSFL